MGNLRRSYATLAAALLVAAAGLAGCGGRSGDQTFERDGTPAAGMTPSLPEINMPDLNLAREDDAAAEATEALGGAICFSPDGAPYEAESC